MAETVCPVWIGYLLTNPIRKLLQISEKDFGITVSIAEQNGFKAIDNSRISRSRVALLEK